MSLEALDLLNPALMHYGMASFPAGRLLSCSWLKVCCRIFKCSALEYFLLVFCWFSLLLDPGFSFLSCSTGSPTDQHASRYSAEPPCLMPGIV
ncbi:hypothetical protein HHUSO_G21448 [Huso huso]|uniref:Uncharacterized protein n=1 Tax=Huso huso TaxID=61971 RepID=A0ABR0YZM3_HUSHU